MWMNVPIQALWLKKALISELLSEPDENPFGTADVAESVDTLIVDDFIHYGRTELAKARESVIKVLDSKHDA